MDSFTLFITSLGEFHNLLFDGGRGSLCARDAQPELTAQHHLPILSLVAKLERDDIGVLLLCRDLDDGEQVIGVPNPCPTRTIRGLS